MRRRQRTMSTFDFRRFATLACASESVAGVFASVDDLLYTAKYVYARVYAMNMWIASPIYIRAEKPAHDFTRQFDGVCMTRHSKKSDERIHIRVWRVAYAMCIENNKWSAFTLRSFCAWAHTLPWRAISANSRLLHRSVHGNWGVDMERSVYGDRIHESTLHVLAIVCGLVTPSECRLYCGGFSFHNVIWMASFDSLRIIHIYWF